MTKPVDGRMSLILREKREYLSTSIISAYFTRIRIAVQLREHAQIPTRPARLLAAIRANSLTLRQSARWQQLAQSSWRNQSWVLRISTATGCSFHAALVTESKLGPGYLFCYVTAENWIITIRLNFIAICGIILLISIVFLKSIPNNNMNSWIVWPIT